MTRLEERLKQELTGVSQDDVDPNFTVLFATQLRRRRRRRVLLLVLATIVAAALAAGLMTQLTALAPI